MWGGLLLLLIGCKSEGETPAAQTIQSDAPVEVGGFTYRKPDGVLLDISRIVGRKHSSVLGTELEMQLGALLQERRLPGVRGVEFEYENARLAVVKDVIYYVAYPFKVPVNRVLALQQIGLPGNLSPLRPRSLQFRIDRPTHGIRRIALQRAEMNSEIVTQIEVWSSLPTEQF